MLAQILKRSFLTGVGTPLQVPTGTLVMIVKELGNYYKVLYQDNVYRVLKSSVHIIQEQKVLTAPALMAKSVRQEKQRHQNIVDQIERLGNDD